MLTQQCVEFCRGIDICHKYILTKIAPKKRGLWPYLILFVIILAATIIVIYGATVDVDIVQRFAGTDGHAGNGIVCHKAGYSSLSRPYSSAPPPVMQMPFSAISAANSGGTFSSTL